MPNDFTVLFAPLLPHMYSRFMWSLIGTNAKSISTSVFVPWV